MKKHLLALAILSAFGAAHAQSSVTLYGVADAAIESVKGATSLTRLTSGQQQGSRWGLRGTEDLGGGMNAGFVLEAGFSLDTGALPSSGKAFHRQSFVSLGGGFGAIRLGRQYSPIDDVAGIVGTKTYDLLSVSKVIGVDAFDRLDNTLTYVSPKLGGFTFQLQHSLGAENPTTSTSPDANKTTGAHVMYSGGPLNVGFAVVNVADADGAVAGDQERKASILTGSYAFGDFKVSGYYSVNDVDTNNDFKAYGIYGVYAMGANTVALGLGQTKNSAGVADRDASLWTLQGTHNLSKRTALYAHYTRVSNDNSSQLGFNDPVAGGSSTGVQFGVRHRF